MPGDELWRSVDRLVDRAPSVADLISHKLDLFAARRWRALGREVPEALLARERRAAVGAMAVPLLLERVRDACDGELVVMKGPAVAARYPDPALRSFGDIDLLVADAAEVQARLVAAGFVEVGDPELYVDIHHLRPLAFPGLPLGVEVHSRPNWPPHGVHPPPPTSELVAAAEPFRDGFRALSPAHHALLLAAHSWRHEPLRRLRDMLDVVVMADVAGRANVAAVARRWGVDRLWRSTIGVADSVLSGEARPWALRLWAQNLERVQERTVLENHLARLLSDFWIMRIGLALARLPATALDELRPAADEGWRTKLTRSRLALRNASRRRSEHDHELGGR